jgi:nucleoside-diphosphate kinase
MEQTLLIVKPDAIAANRIGEILSRVVRAGFSIRGLKMRHLSREEAREFYSVHRGKPFYEPLIEFMSSGPVVVACLQKDQAIADLRKLIGATDPAKAEAGTIRSDFARDVQHNAVHASDGPDTARQEIAFFFAQNELIRP